MRHRKYRTPGERGLILIEAVIAIGVLTIMFAGVLSLFTRSLVGVRESSDQLIATYLAQDAAEYIRAKIVSNTEAGLVDWSRGVVCNDICEVDTTTSIDSFALTACDPTGAGGCVLQLDDATGQYSTVSGTPSPYKRTVKIVESDPNPTSAVTPGELKITINVSWDEGGNSGEVPLTFSLYAPK